MLLYTFTDKEAEAQKWWCVFSEGTQLTGRETEIKHAREGVFTNIGLKQAWEMGRHNPPLLQPET